MNKNILIGGLAVLVLAAGGVWHYSRSNASDTAGTSGLAGEQRAFAPAPTDMRQGEVRKYGDSHHIYMI